jgi:hypothetical protein
MSTQTLREAARLLGTVLIDEIQIYNVGDPVTVGFEVTRPLTAVGDPVAGLVQGTTLENAVESQTSTIWSVKVHRDTPLVAGQAVRVITCEAEPGLVGKTLLLDKVSLQGAAMIRKGVASDVVVVNQEGKEGIAP